MTMKITFTELVEPPELREKAWLLRLLMKSPRVDSNQLKDYLEVLCQRQNCPNTSVQDHPMTKNQIIKEISEVREEALRASDFVNGRVFHIFSVTNLQRP